MKQLILTAILTLGVLGCTKQEVKEPETFSFDPRDLVGSWNVTHRNYELQEQVFLFKLSWDATYFNGSWSGKYEITGNRIVLKSEYLPETWYDILSLYRESMTLKTKSGDLLNCVKVEDDGK